MAGNVIQNMNLTIFPHSLKIIIILQVTPNDRLCAAVSNIEFGKDEDAESELEISQTSTFEFDVNASVADIESEAPPPRLAVPSGGYDSGEEIAMPQEAPRRAAPASIVDMKRRLSVHNMEYSMFDEKVRSRYFYGRGR